MILSLEKTAQRYRSDNPESETILDTALAKFDSGNQCWVTPVGRRAADDTMRIVFMMEWEKQPSEEDARAMAQLVTGMVGGFAMATQAETTNQAEAMATANLMLADTAGPVQ